MRAGQRIKEVLSKLEILLAAVLFVAMLVSCGLYIDIKINGKISSLPTLSEADKKLLLRTVASESVTYSDDLIEPVFVGIRNETEMIAVCPDASARNAVENAVYHSLNLLFSGTSEEIEFDSENKREEYVNKLKQSERFMLIGFYNELPSSVILPCLSKNYDIGGVQKLFFVKFLFLLADDNGNLYGVTISDDGVVTKLTCSENVPFNKIISDSYDINNGYVYFEFDDTALLKPVLSTSFLSNKYKLSNSAADYGKEKNTEWVSRLFDVFSINSSLVKEYPSNNNMTINYIDDAREVTVSDDGFVEFRAGEGQGIYLDEYLGYLPDSNSGYTFNDKVFAIKSVLNKLVDNKSNSHLFGIVGVEYDKDSGDFAVYLKNFSNGILVSDRNYDATLEIKNDCLTYASFYAVNYEMLDDYSVIIPQKYSDALQKTPDISVISPLLLPENEGSDIHVLKWAINSPETEVAE